MELIRVNSVKLKIILTPEDMKGFDLTADELDYAYPKTRRAFRQILEKAREETGFDIKNEKIYVQVFPSVDGGCEMFLTRKDDLLPEPATRASSAFRPKYRIAERSFREDKRYIAKSAELENVIRLCKRLHDCGFSGTSVLYRHAGFYYLVVRLTARMPSFVQASSDFDDGDGGRFSFMSDYADLFFADALPLSFLEEHGTVIVGADAVSVIAETFK